MYLVISSTPKSGFFALSLRDCRIFNLTPFSKCPSNMDMLQGIKVMSKDGGLRPIKYALKNKRIVIYLFSASYVNRPEFMSKLKSVYQENLKRSAVVIKRVICN